MAYNDRDVWLSDGSGGEGERIQRMYGGIMRKRLMLKEVLGARYEDAKDLFPFLLLLSHLAYSSAYLPSIMLITFAPS